MKAKVESSVHLKVRCYNDDMSFIEEKLIELNFGNMALYLQDSIMEYCECLIYDQTGITYEDMEFLE